MHRKLVHQTPLRRDEIDVPELILRRDTLRSTYSAAFAVNLAQALATSARMS